MYYNMQIHIIIPSVVSLASHSYEVTSNKFSRNLIRELTLSFFASVFLGFGTVFLLLTVGIYV